MIFLLQQGNYQLFAVLIIALVFSLSVHEYGHAQVAKWQGDDTAERAGRLTLSPLAHIDPVGLLMVVMVGFGYAKPVPVNPARFRSKLSEFWVAGAGPCMNLILAIISWNTLVLLTANGLANQGIYQFFSILAHINLLLMIFNLVPIGPLDGHYMLPHLLPDGLADRYRRLNARYGTFLLMGLVAASLFGVPIFSHLHTLTQAILPFITVL